MFARKNGHGRRDLARAAMRRAASAAVEVLEGRQLFHSTLDANGLLTVYGQSGYVSTISLDAVGSQNETLRVTRRGVSID